MVAEMDEARAIGELAKKSQVSVDSIRFYEKRGVLKAPKRADNNYRYYDDQALDQLIFIRHCRELGMSLNEIETLQQLLEHPEQQCTLVDQAIAKILKGGKTVGLNVLKNWEQRMPYFLGKGVRWLNVHVNVFIERGAKQYSDLLKQHAR